MSHESEFGNQICIEDTEEQPFPDNPPAVKQSLLKAFTSQTGAFTYLLIARNGTPLKLSQLRKDYGKLVDWEHYSSGRFPAYDEILTSLVPLGLIGSANLGEGFFKNRIFYPTKKANAPGIMAAATALWANHHLNLPIDDCLGVKDSVLPKTAIIEKLASGKTIDGKKLHNATGADPYEFKGYMNSLTTHGIIQQVTSGTLWKDRIFALTPRGQDVYDNVLFPFTVVSTPDPLRPKDQFERYAAWDRKIKKEIIPCVEKNFTEWGRIYGQSRKHPSQE